MQFFTEREGELPPQNSDQISLPFIEAIANELIGLGDRAWLAGTWPLYCQDRERVVIGTDQEKFWKAAKSKLKLSASHPDELVNEPNPLVILNVIEYVDRNIGRPEVIGEHPYYGHRHLRIHEGVGEHEFRDGINELFKRYGLAYELTEEGTVIRLSPEEIQSKLVDAVFGTGDSQLDDLLNSARRKYLDPSPATRRESLEKLWDAFERLKTITVGPDKKAQVTALIEQAYADADVRVRLNTELNELTAIGNGHNIRHFETSKLPIPDDTFVDWLFVRCYAAIHAILEKTGGVKH